MEQFEIIEVEEEDNADLGWEECPFRLSVHETYPTD
jgi:hypothetical protein